MRARRVLPTAITLALAAVTLPPLVGPAPPATADEDAQCTAVGTRITCVYDDPATVTVFPAPDAPSMRVVVEGGAGAPGMRDGVPTSAGGAGAVVTHDIQIDPAGTVAPGTSLRLNIGGNADGRLGGGFGGGHGGGSGDTYGGGGGGVSSVEVASTFEVLVAAAGGGGRRRDSRPRRGRRRRRRH
ncbi:hypothetical protein [Nocardioides sp. TF02-7]|uniref:hypothetical protein n=1 Tax=Nocardioides sp. TF02-7 TaxID=2917724 RepID=UPI0023D9E6EE|nr:hypothetical protein [Nocardioides sp. TF02-7]